MSVVLFTGLLAAQAMAGAAIGSVSGIAPNGSRYFPDTSGPGVGHTAVPIELLVGMGERSSGIRLLGRSGETFATRGLIANTSQPISNLPPRPGPKIPFFRLPGTRARLLAEHQAQILADRRLAVVQYYRLFGAIGDEKGFPHYGPDSGYVGKIRSTALVGQNTPGDCAFIAFANSIAFAATRAGFRINMTHLRSMTSATYRSYAGGARSSAHHGESRPFASLSDVTRSFNQLFANHNLDLRVQELDLRVRGRKAPLYIPSDFRIRTGDSDQGQGSRRSSLNPSDDVVFQRGDVFGVVLLIGGASIGNSFSQHAISLLDVSSSRGEIAMVDQYEDALYFFSIDELHAHLAAQPQGGELLLANYHFTDRSGLSLSIRDAVGRLNTVDWKTVLK